MVDLLLAQLGARRPVQERGRGQHVSVRLDADELGREHVLEEDARREAREPPVVAPAVPFVAVDLADTAVGRQDNASRRQDAVEGPNRRSRVGMNGKT